MTETAAENVIVAAGVVDIAPVTETVEPVTGLIPCPLCGTLVSADTKFTAHGIKAEKEPKVKTPVYKIYLGVDGKEIGRKEYTKGKPPVGAFQVAGDKNWYIPFKAEEEKTPVFYLLVDRSTGTIFAKEEKGRGKPRGDYHLESGGDFAGNYVKYISPVYTAQNEVPFIVEKDKDVVPMQAEVEEIRAVHSGELPSESM